MYGIEINELIAMIISVIAIINFPFIIKKRKNFLKYIPGLSSLIISFVISALDDIVELYLFDLIEIFFLLAGASLVLTALLIELSEIRANNSERKQESFNSLELHGEIIAESDGKNKGATFIIKIPKNKNNIGKKKIL